MNTTNPSRYVPRLPNRSATRPNTTRPTELTSVYASSTQLARKARRGSARRRRAGRR
ncbi:hypothetical protein ACFFV7_00930 [Nonomuraea spiralis]|uniref:Uncharacterized protein n=1 Tax=Nonomuraea spiralis TaxID=46182 RepID=A0ABV5I7F9_9ACTN|nr:hypothetical protein [Nonomuraea spiralis]